MTGRLPGGCGCPVRAPRLCNKLLACVHELCNLMQQGSCGPVSWGVGAWLGPKPQGVFDLRLWRRLRFGGRRAVYVRACLAFVAHILVPVGTRLGMGLPGPVVLEQGWYRRGGRISGCCCEGVENMLTSVLPFHPSCVFQTVAPPLPVTPICPAVLDRLSQIQVFLLPAASVFLPSNHRPTALPPRGIGFASHPSERQNERG